MIIIFSNLLILYFLFHFFSLVYFLPYLFLFLYLSLLLHHLICTLAESYSAFSIFTIFYITFFYISLFPDFISLFISSYSSFEDHLRICQLPILIKHPRDFASGVFPFSSGEVTYLFFWHYILPFFYTFSFYLLLYLQQFIPKPFKFHPFYSSTFIHFSRSLFIFSSLFTTSLLVYFVSHSFLFFVSFYYYFMTILLCFIYYIIIAIYYITYYYCFPIYCFFLLHFLTLFPFSLFASNYFILCRYFVFYVCVL